MFQHIAKLSFFSLLGEYKVKYFSQNVFGVGGGGNREQESKGSNTLPWAKSLNQNQACCCQMIGPTVASRQ